MKTAASSFPRYPLFLALGAYLLDQATKWWVVHNIDLHTGFAVIPGWFNLVHTTNTGAAFGMFQGNNFPFIVLSVVVLAVLFYLLRRGAFPSAVQESGVGLLVGGILGNLTDRLVHGHVIDFLEVDLHVRFANPWPSFNVADSCICIAAFLFILTSFKAPPEKAAGDRPA